MTMPLAATLPLCQKLQCYYGSHNFAQAGLSPMLPLVLTLLQRVASAYHNLSCFQFPTSQMHASSQLSNEHDT